MKKGKTLSLLGFAITALGVLGLASCGEAKDTNKASATPSVNDKTTTTTYKTPTKAATYWQEKTVEEFTTENVSGKNVGYQFVGSADVNRKISIMINLYDDGYVRALQCLDDGSKNYYYGGYWTNIEDDHIFVGISAYWFAENIAEGYSTYCTLDYSYELSVDDGLFDFSFNACLGYANGGQYVRSVSFKGNGYETYSTEAAFVSYCIDYWKGSSNVTDDTKEDTDVPYTNNALLLEDFTPDISSQIKAVYYSEASEWGPTLGQSEYVPTESEDTLLTFSTVNGEPYNIQLKKNGTYTFNYSSMNLSENGTWTWKSYSLSLTTPKGNVFTSKIYRTA